MPLNHHAVFSGRKIFTSRTVEFTCHVPVTSMNRSLFIYIVSILIYTSWRINYGLNFVHKM